MQRTENCQSAEEIIDLQPALSQTEYEECCQCSNAVCCCGFCCFIPLCTLSGMLGSYYLTLLVEPYLKAYYGVTTATNIMSCVSITSMFGGLGGGFTLWGTTTDCAAKWEKKQMKQNKSYSIFSPFRSCHASNEYEYERLQDLPESPTRHIANDY
jgi:hypothetical protein